MSRCFICIYSICKNRKVNSPISSEFFYSAHQRIFVRTVAVHLIKEDKGRDLIFRKEFP